MLIELTALTGCISAGGPPYTLTFADGTSRPATPEEVLAAERAARIAAINAECHRRITSQWPLDKQISASLGVYGQAQLDSMTAWIESHIDASNAASDAVDAAQTVQAVAAVEVAWP